MEVGAGKVVNLGVEELGNSVLIASVSHTGRGGESLGAGGHSGVIAWNR